MPCPPSVAALDEEQHLKRHVGVEALAKEDDEVGADADDPRWPGKNVASDAQPHGGKRGDDGQNLDWAHGHGARISAQSTQPQSAADSPPAISARGLTFSAARVARAVREPTFLSSHMRLHSVGLLLLAAPLAAQPPRQLTAEDYARAERFLGVNTAPLVTGIGVRPTWLADGRFWYRTTVPTGSAFFVVDPARRTREAVFDQSRLALALAAVSGGRVEGNRLPFQTFELAKDSRSITVS